MRLSKKQKWTTVVVYTTVIYATLPIMRGVLNFLNKCLENSLGFWVNIIFFLIGLFFLFYLINKYRIKVLTPYIWLIFLAGIYTYFLIVLKRPEERIHFLEYGLLGYFVYLALSESFSSPKNYYFSFILVGILGWIDEGIQGVLPNRVYDIRDVGMNALGGLLGLLVTRFVIQKR